MADSQAVAKLLLEFHQSAAMEAGRNFAPEGMRTVGAPPTPARSLPQIYVDCVALLAVEERDVLTSLLNKMRGGLGPRPGRHRLRAPRERR